MVATNILDLVDVAARKGPEIKDGLSPRRKRKSVAELISVPETTPVASSRKHKPKEIVSSVHLPSVKGSVFREGRGRRASTCRRHTRFDTKRSNSSKDKEVEETKDVEDSGEGKMSALRKYAGISADVILSQLLLAASCPLCPKSNRPGAKEKLESMILTLTGPSSGIVTAEIWKAEVKENLVLEMQVLLNKK